MLMVKAMKILMFASLMMPIGMATLGTGILFGFYSIAVANNPDEADAIYNTTLAGFAFIESFVFLVYLLVLLFVLFINLNKSY